LLARCVRRALFFDGAGVSLDTASLAALRERFWADTADAFFAIIERAGGGAPEAGLTEPWRRTLDVTARRLFDEAAPMDATAEGHPNRIAAAARQLDFALRGFGKDGETLFTVLGLAVPEVARKLKQHRGGKAA
jgi:CRISPR system Cascade subunit CasA